MKGKQEITIQHPEAWELLVSLQGKRVRYILFTPAVANSLYIDEVECAEESLQGLEDAVLNTPVLLDDYKRVRIVVYPQHFVLFPQEVSDEDCTALLHEAFPADDGDAAVCLMPKNGVKVAYLLPCGIQAFVGRTFNYPVVVPHLVPLGIQRIDDMRYIILWFFAFHYFMIVCERKTPVVKQCRFYVLYFSIGLVHQIHHFTFVILCGFC